MKRNTYYDSTHWNKLRGLVLKRDGYTCTHCGVLALGRNRNGIRPMVDHVEPRPRGITSPTGFDRPENLVTLCHSCHNKKTKLEDHNSRPEIGPDGFPVGGWN